MIFEINNYQLDCERFQLTCDQQPITIEPKTFDLIRFLVTNRERVVSRQEIFDNLWQDLEVGDSVLSNHIKIARKALGDNGQAQKIIKTVHGRGYQFIGPVKEIVLPPEQSNSQPAIPVVTAPVISEANDLISSKIKTTRKTLVWRVGLAVFVLLFSWLMVSQFIAPRLLTKDAASNNIAVLPFINLRPDDQTNYFGFAIADQVIGELAYVQNVAVRPSAAIRKYSNVVADIDEVRDTLDIDYVVNGSYLKLGNDIRLSIELIDAKSKQLVWREKNILVKYENAFVLQDMVAKKVVKGLHIQFSENEIERISKDVSSSPLAYEYYFKSLTYPYTNQDNGLAAAMLKKSIALDQYYAPAYAELGNRTRRLEQFGLVDSSDPDLVENYFLKSLSINPDLMTALSYLSMFYTETNRIDEAMMLAKRMSSINPNNANTHFTLGYIYRYVGLVDKSIEEMEAAVKIDPNNPAFRSIVGTYAGAHQFELARKMVDSMPENSFTLGWRASFAHTFEKNDEAIIRYNELINRYPNGLWGKVATIHLASIINNPAAAVTAIKSLESNQVTDGETIFYNATYYGMIKDKEGVIRTLNQAIAAGYFNYDFIKNDAYFQFMKDEPKFLNILALCRSKRDQFTKRFFQSSL